VNLGTFSDHNQYLTKEKTEETICVQILGMRLKPKRRDSSRHDDTGLTRYTGRKGDIYRLQKELIEEGGLVPLTQDHNWVHPDFVVNGQIPEWLVASPPQPDESSVRRPDRIHTRGPDYGQKESLHERDLRGRLIIRGCRRS